MNGPHSEHKPELNFEQAIFTWDESMTLRAAEEWDKGKVNKN